MNTSSATAQNVVNCLFLTDVVRSLFAGDSVISNREIIADIRAAVKVNGLFDGEMPRVIEIVKVADQVRSEISASAKTVIVKAVEGASRLTEAEQAAVKAASDSQYSKEDRVARAIAWKTWTGWLEKHPLDFFDGKVEKLAETIFTGTKPETTVDQLSAVIKIDRGRRWDAMVAEAKVRAERLSLELFLNNKRDKRRLFEIAEAINAKLPENSRVPKKIFCDALFKAKGRAMATGR